MAFALPRRVTYLLVFIFSLISLHLLLSLVREDYANITQSYLKSRPLSNSRVDPAPDPISPDLTPTTLRANATIVMLARNSDRAGAAASITALEQRFNRRFNYPYVFLNDVPFDDDFKKTMRAIIKEPTKVDFGLIPKEHWEPPNWIDEAKAKAARDAMVQAQVQYAGSVAYRNMCRYNSGFFYKHELLLNYKWYWRVEPDVDFYCDIHEDPFMFMETYNKTYGFNVVMYENMKSIPGLWDYVKKFATAHPDLLPPDNSMGFLSQDDGKTYNSLHFWSNFEIASLDFWRSPAYTAFFDYLEAAGGFYYERWGDAPVHSIGAGLFLPRDQIHFFEDIGYRHGDVIHCPLTSSVWERGNCSCKKKDSCDNQSWSGKPIWDKFMRSST